MNRRISVLVVDDEPRVLRFVRAELESDGYRVLVASSGRQAIELHESERPALVILDLIMPDLDGFEVLRRIRVSAKTPVIVLTARGSDVDKIRGLDLGADDYLTKPFNPEELAARMRAVLRRAQGPAVADERQVVTFGSVQVDLERRRVSVDGEDASLSPTEWQLLMNLVQHAGRVILHEDLLSMTWGPEYRNDLQYLRVWVSRLRRKLGETSHHPGLIKTVPGVGYMIREADPAGPPRGAGPPQDPPVGPAAQAPDPRDDDGRTGDPLPRERLPGVTAETVAETVADPAETSS